MTTIQARKAPSGDFSRSHERWEVSIDISLQILIPEDTFTPRGLEGKTVDLSARGMKVAVSQMTGDTYKKLLKGTRYARVCLTNPSNEEQLKLTGQIAWFDFHKPDAASPHGICNMGIQFDDKTGPALSQYENFIQMLDAA